MPRPLGDLTLQGVIISESISPLTLPGAPATCTAEASSGKQFSDRETVALLQISRESPGSGHPGNGSVAPHTCARDTGTERGAWLCPVAVRQAPLMLALKGLVARLLEMPGPDRTCVSASRPLAQTRRTANGPTSPEPRFRQSESNPSSRVHATNQENETLLSEIQR